MLFCVVWVRAWHVSLTGVPTDDGEWSETVIIDCHGHFTTAPPAVGAWRAEQEAAVTADPTHKGVKGRIGVSDDEIRDALESSQLRFQKERGTDLTLFSPRASWMGHHVGNQHTSKFWSEHQNELIRKVRFSHHVKKEEYSQPLL